MIYRNSSCIIVDDIQKLIMHHHNKQYIFQRSYESIEVQLNKLEHRLADVRDRAANALLSSVQLGLLPAEALIERLKARLISPLWRGREPAIELIKRLKDTMRNNNGSPGATTRDTIPDFSTSGGSLVTVEYHQPSASAAVPVFSGPSSGLETTTDVYDHQMTDTGRIATCIETRYVPTTCGQAEHVQSTCRAPFVHSHAARAEQTPASCAAESDHVTPTCVQHHVVPPCPQHHVVPSTCPQHHAAPPTCPRHHATPCVHVAGTPGSDVVGNINQVPCSIHSHLVAPSQSAAADGSVAVNEATPPLVSTDPHTQSNPSPPVATAAHETRTNGHHVVVSTREDTADHVAPAAAETDTRALLPVFRQHVSFAPVPEPRRRSRAESAVDVPMVDISFNSVFSEGYDTAVVEENSAEDTNLDLTNEQEPDFKDFPWMDLCTSDRHVLENTCAALTSGDQPVVLRTLSFLTDVTMRDFPPQVFLQRPGVLRAVLDLLAAVKETDTDTIVACVQCLYTLTTALLDQHQTMCTAGGDCTAADEQQRTQNCDSPVGGPSTLCATPLCPSEFGALALSQALSCLYVRHWRTLAAAVCLARHACALLRRLPAVCLWQLDEGQQQHPTTAADLERRQRTYAAVDRTMQILSGLLGWHRSCFLSAGGDPSHVHRSGWLLAAALVPPIWSALRPPPAHQHRLLPAALSAIFDELLHAQQPVLHSQLLATVACSGATDIWRRLQQLQVSATAAQKLIRERDLVDVKVARCALECAELHAGCQLSMRLAEVACHQSVTSKDDVTSAARLLHRLMTSMLDDVRVVAFGRAAESARAALTAAGHADVMVLLTERIIYTTLTKGVHDPKTTRDAVDVLSYAVAAEAWRPEVRCRLVGALPLLLAHVGCHQLSRHLNHVLQLAGSGAAASRSPRGRGADVINRSLLADLLLACHRSDVCRSDAWQRIIRRLQQLDSNKDALLPDLYSLKPELLTDMMLVSDPEPVISRISQPSDLQRALHLLESLWRDGEAEGAVSQRRAQLAELAALLQDPSMHASFLQADGVIKLRHLLYRAMQEDPDPCHDVSLAPHCVRALRHLAVFGEGCRLLLAEDTSLQNLLVRVLMVFRTDRVVRVTVCQLLVALCLDTTLLCRRSGTPCHWHTVVPDVVAHTFRLPYVVTPEAELGRGSRESRCVRLFREPVTVEGREISCVGVIRSIWHASCHGPLHVAPPQNPDYSARLLMPEWQLLAARSGQLQLVADDVLQQLSGVSSQTTARSLLDQLGCLLKLQAQLLLEPSHTVSVGCGEGGVLGVVSVDRWQQTLRRYLLRPVTSEGDLRLLNATLRLLAEMPTDSAVLQQVLSCLAEHRQVFVCGILEAIGSSDAGMSSQAMTAAEILSSMATSAAAAADITGCQQLLWDWLARGLTDAVADTLSQTPGDLARIQRLVDVVTGLQREDGDELPASVDTMRQLCLAVTPTAGAHTSWMGTGVLQAAVASLAHLADMRRCWCQEWGNLWRADGVPNGGQLNWLVKLWNHKHMSIRWSSLMAGVCLTRWLDGASLLVHQTHTDSADVWHTAFAIMASDWEHPAVRQLAAWVLVGLTSQMDVSSATLDLSTGSSEVVDDAAPPVSVEGRCGPVVVFDDGGSARGVPALIALIDHWNWITHLTQMVRSLGATPSAARLTLLAASLRFTHNLLALSPSQLISSVSDVIALLARHCTTSLVVSVDVNGQLEAVLLVWEELLRLCHAALQLLHDVKGARLRQSLLADTTLLNTAADVIEQAGGVQLADSARRLLLMTMERILLQSQVASLPPICSLLGAHPTLCLSLPNTCPSFLTGLLRLEAYQVLLNADPPPTSCWLPEAPAASRQLCTELLQLPADSPAMPLLLLTSATAKKMALLSVCWLSCQMNALRNNIDTLLAANVSLKTPKMKAKARLVLCSLDLLRNLMSGCVEAKERLSADGLAELLHRLWHRAADSQSLTISVLCTLSTMAAGCVEGGRRLACTSSGGSSTALRQTSSTHAGGSATTIGGATGAVIGVSSGCGSMVHSVLELCRRQLQHRRLSLHNHQLLAVSFSLLAAAVSAQEARNIVCRGSFLSGFCFNKSQCKTAAELRYHVTVSRLWLLLIKNLTFHEDGQRALLKVPDVLGSLVSMIHQSDVYLMCSSMLVLRNLSFLSSAQTAIVGAAGLVEGVCEALSSGHPAAQAAASALLWRLLTAGAKVRALLTSGESFRKLKLAVDSPDSVGDAEACEALEHVKRLLSAHSTAR